MKNVFWMIVGVVLLSASAVSTSGEVKSECQKQAKEYGIQTELVAQYVADCVVSMGGDPAAAPTALGEGNSSEGAVTESPESSNAPPQSPYENRAIQ